MKLVVEKVFPVSGGSETVGLFEVAYEVALVRHADLRSHLLHAQPGIFQKLPRPLHPEQA